MFIAPLEKHIGGLLKRNTDERLSAKCTSLVNDRSRHLIEPMLNSATYKMRLENTIYEHRGKCLYDFKF